MKDGCKFLPPLPLREESQSPSLEYDLILVNFLTNKIRHKEPSQASEARPSASWFCLGLLEHSFFDSLDAMEEVQVHWGFYAGEMPHVGSLVMVLAVPVFQPGPPRHRRSEENHFGLPRPRVRMSECPMSARKYARLCRSQGLFCN